MTDRTLGLISTAIIALGITATAYATIHSIPRVVMTLSDVQQ
ncbi:MULTISPECIES: hypothetical protein [unclassified Aurantimonas]|nr:MULTISPECIES: hypothetical protein [unclassified Aurantimonas]MEC5289434.1 hypothetical protein [Aurantimonas sp. C2-3-R2]MEC5410514.1 hypothetical protein [Aurantimonas sp. C2-4-R8]